MDRIDGNSRSENNQLPGNSIRHQNDVNDDSFDFIRLGISLNTRGISDNLRQSDSRHMPTHALPNPTSMNSNSNTYTRKNTHGNIYTSSVVSHTGTQTIYTDTLPTYEHGLQNAEDMQTVARTDDEPVIDLAVVWHVTPHYVRKLQQIECEFAIELRL